MGGGVPIKSDGRYDAVTGYNVYCRSCGRMLKGGQPTEVTGICWGPLDVYPDKCPQCGSILIGPAGWSISGDSSEDNTTIYSGPNSGLCHVGKIWHPVR